MRSDHAVGLCAICLTGGLRSPFVGMLSIELRRADAATPNRSWSWSVSCGAVWEAHEKHREGPSMFDDFHEIRHQSRNFNDLRQPCPTISHAFLWKI